MADDNIRALSGSPLTPAEKIGLTLAVLAICFGFIIGALAAAGVVDMSAAQAMLVAAWIFAISGAYIVEKLSARSRRRIVISVSLTAIMAVLLLFALNTWMVRKKAEQEHRPPPHFGEWLLPVATYMQNLPWMWIAISLVAGFLVAVWLLIILLKGERKKGGSEAKKLQDQIDELDQKKTALEIGRSEDAITIQEHETKVEILTKRVKELKEGEAASSKAVEDSRKEAERLQQLAESHNVRANLNQNLLDQYKWLDEVVEYQRYGLRKYVLVEKCDINLSPLSEGKLYIELTFSVFNYSLFYVSVPMPADRAIEGSINFKGEPLSGTAKFIDKENRVEKLPPYSGNFFKVRQWVNQDEAKDIPKTWKESGNLFGFPETCVYVRADKFPDDKPAKLDLTRAMQNASLENTIVELGNENALLRKGLTFWRDRTRNVKELTRILGMFYLAYNQAEQNEILSKATGDNLRGSFANALHYCFHDNKIVDKYLDNEPALPDSLIKQKEWVDSHCIRLRALIAEQEQGLSDYVQNEGSTPNS